MTLAQKYRKSKSSSWCLRLKTIHPDGDAYDGVVTDIKRHFVVMQIMDDFEFSSVEVFPKKFIKGYRDGRFEMTCNEILRQNGQLDRIHRPQWIASCDSIPQIFDELKHRDVWPGVETIFDDGNDSAFYIGPIVATDKTEFLLYCYSAAGEWERVYTLPYDEVFRISIDDRYCNYFNAYMRSKSDTLRTLETFKSVFEAGDDDER